MNLQLAQVIGFGVWGLGFRVSGSGFGVWGLGIRPGRSSAGTTTTSPTRAAAS